MSTADMPTMPVNGNYAAQQAQAYGVPEQNFVSHNNTSSISTDYAQQTTQSTSTSNGGDSPSKEEVGWYFVEQYYTTMSRSPDRLYLFYNKRSQFLMGTEAEKVMTAVGQKAINQKILDQEIKECKVRVSNVDTQGSGQNIVIQVIGEISINNAPQKKFIQTFVLAEQTNGYFVLNDIFRFLVEEEEEALGAEAEQQIQQPSTEAVTGYQEPSPTAVVDDPASQVLTSSADTAAREHDAQLVDESIKNIITDDQGHVEPPAAAVNGDAEPAATEIVQAQEAPAAATVTADEPAQSAEHIADAVSLEEVVAPEKPKDPEPSRAASPPEVAETLAAPSKPAAPKTWANLVAGNRVALPAGPSSTAPASATQPKAAPTAPSTSSAQTPPAVAASVAAPATSADEAERPATPKSASSEWQTAQRHDHGKKHTRPQAAVNPEQNRGYIKNVGDEVVFDELRSHLAKFGELHYFDINRSKRCAFVDWKEPKGYQAATAANPHRLSNVTVNVEERHVKPPGVVANSGNFRGNFRSNSRGGFGDRGGRGGGAGRGRGGTRGGRGGATPAAA